MRRSLLLIPLLAVPLIVGGTALTSSAFDIARLPDAFRGSDTESATDTSTKKATVKKTGEYAFFEGGVPPVTIPEDLWKTTVPAEAAMAVYVTPNAVAKDESFDAYMDALQAAGGNAFVIGVKGGYVFFPTEAPLAKQHDTVRPVGDLKEIVKKAHERELYVIARFVALNDPILAERVPDAQVKHPSTGVGLGPTWVDGSNPFVLEYNRQILADLLSTGVDEINLDYIRFPTEYPGILNALTTEAKVAHIEPFVKMARAVVDEVSPTTKLGLSTYAILGWNYPINLHALGQDFVKFAPYVDIISPMAYPSTFTSPEYYNPAKHGNSRDYWLVYRTLDGYKKLLGEEHWRKLRPWIQGYFIDQQDMLDQIRAVHDADLCGFNVWNAQNNYEPTFKGMSRMPDMPERCASL